MKKLKYLLLVGLLCVTGCNEKPTDQVVNGNENDENNNVVEEKISIVDMDSKTRPIAVMINNHKSAQPYQTGLNDAYIVYEMIVEGGITRMMAVFKDSTISNVGTIRSARPYYLDYVLENDALYVHFGGSYKALDEIKTLGINNLNGMADNFYWRENFPVSTEHTVYSSMEKINNTIKRKGYRTESSENLLLNYSAKEIDVSSLSDSIEANDVKIVYSSYQTNEFVYDASSKVYKKYSNGTLRTDNITKEPFTVKNIITYQVNNYTIDSYGCQALDNIGSGYGYYISNGYAVKITWEKKSRESKTIYRYLDGTIITVNDGNTYIQIQPKGQTLEIK